LFPNLCDHGTISGGVNAEAKTAKTLVQSGDGEYVPSEQTEGKKRVANYSDREKLPDDIRAQVEAGPESTDSPREDDPAPEIKAGAAEAI
jgi:hypothetical protein